MSMDFEKCILILKQAIQKLNINMYHLQGEANTNSVIDLLTQIDDEIGKTPKPRTNFDKITESVESLAKFIEKYATNCNYCPLYKLEKCDIKGWKLDKEYCKKEIIKWLQQEIDDEL